MTVALITGLEMPKPDPETPALLAALDELDISAEVLPWRGRRVDWDVYELIVLRTPWDYTAHAPEWLAWIAARASTLENPADVVTWTSHKGYLLDLDAAGIPVVPTVLIRAGADQDEVGRAVESVGAGDDTSAGQVFDLVVKPAVGVGGRGMQRVGDRLTAAAVALQMARAGDVILQPFQPDVLSGGEVSIVCFDGRVSHAVRKRPGAGDFRIHQHYGGTVEVHTPTEAELRVAEAAIAAAPAPTLYGRVDLIGAREPRVGELELVEPELFLHQDEGAAARFAEAIQTRLVR